MTTLITDPAVAGLPVHDNAEPLVDLASRGIACAAVTPEQEAGRRVRSGLADRLVLAQAALPAGLRLLVVEGFRTPEAQLAAREGYLHDLRNAYPGAGEDELRRLASRYVAPLEVAPHVAGAAVDVTLTGADGRELDMGTPLDATPEESGDAIRFDADSISSEARANRTLLAGALTPVGLVNYPTEWWHWSYGDRYWAFVTGAASASYGPVGP